MTESLTDDREAFFDQFTKEFFSVNGTLKVSEEQRQEAIKVCLQSDEKAALKCMESFGTEDFRDDLPNVTVATLVIHGDGDGTVPFKGSGARTHAAIPHSELVVLAGAPHGCNVSHADEFGGQIDPGQVRSGHAFPPLRRIHVPRTRVQDRPVRVPACTTRPAVELDGGAAVMPTSVDDDGEVAEGVEHR